MPPSPAVPPAPAPAPAAEPGPPAAKPPLKKRLGRVAACLFIGGYLTTMASGVVCHALGFGEGSHPLMYYIVWDMFCGWSAQSYRTHVLAEGVSGAWYDAGVGPWEDERPFHPYGRLSRVHYNTEGVHAPRTGFNVLRHTSHEPIVRIAVVEECWAKKFNMPEPYWSARWKVPKDPASYYAVRYVLDAEGQLVAQNPGWAAEVTRRSVQNRDKIRRFASRGAPPTARRATRQAVFDSDSFSFNSDPAGSFRSGPVFADLSN